MLRVDRVNAQRSFFLFRGVRLSGGQRPAASNFQLPIDLHCDQRLVHTNPVLLNLLTVTDTGPMVSNLCDLDKQAHCLEVTSG